MEDLGETVDTSHGYRLDFAAITEKVCVREKGRVIPVFNRPMDFMPAASQPRPPMAPLEMDWKPMRKYSCASRSVLGDG